MSERGGAAFSSEEQERIRALFLSLEETNHYDLLGVPRSAGGAEIQRAYEERLLQFHAGRLSERLSGGLRARLEAILARVSSAYEVLSSTSERAKYDATLLSDHASRVESMLEDTAAGMFREQSGGGTGARARFVLEEPGAPPSAEHTIPAAPPPAPASFAEVHLQLLLWQQTSKLRALDAGETATYVLLREEFSRTVLAAQNITVKPGQQPRKALRVAYAAAVTLTVPSGTVEGQTVDLGVGGLGAVVSTAIARDTACQFELEGPAGPIAGRGRVVGSEPLRDAASSFRLAIAFDEIDALSATWLEWLVLNAALQAFEIR